MSQDNVEIVRRSIEAFQRRQVDWCIELWDLEGEWIPAMAGAVEGKVYRGHAGLRRYFDDFFESFSEVRLDELEFIDLGNRVLALYRLRVRGHDSGVAADQAGATIFQLPDR